MSNNKYDEQETIINIKYAESTVSIYTSRKAIITKLKSKLGEPSKTYYLKKKVSGASWDISFNERKKITSVLSRPLLIGYVN